MWIYYSLIFFICISFPPINLIKCNSVLHSLRARQDLSHTRRHILNQFHYFNSSFFSSSFIFYLLLRILQSVANWVQTELFCTWHGEGTRCEARFEPHSSPYFSITSGTWLQKRRLAGSSMPPASPWRAEVRLRGMQDAGKIAELSAVPQTRRGDQMLFQGQFSAFIAVFIKCLLKD